MNFYNFKSRHSNIDSKIDRKNMPGTSKSQDLKLIYTCNNKRNIRDTYLIVVTRQKSLPDTVAPSLLKFVITKYRIT